MNLEPAEKIAISALMFLAGDGERLERFLALTGLDPARIRQAAAQPGFLAAVLEYVSADERLLVMFAEESALPPHRVNEALMKLAPFRADDFA